MTEAAKTNAKTDRPTALPGRPDGIATELRKRPQWVVWRYEYRKGKWTKVPYTPGTEKKASTTNAATWRTFAKAVKAYKAGGWDGIGYVFGADDPNCGVDLDDCRNPATGDIAEWAAEIIRDLDGYAEVSPSGTGAKLVVRAKLPGSGTRKQFGDGEIELYDRARYFALTGQSIGAPPAAIPDRQEFITELYGRIKGPKDKPVAARPPAGSLTDDDNTILARARRARNGPKFSRLWSGDTSYYGGDHSRADAGLSRVLLFWTQGDIDRADGLFRQSGMYRPKWDERRRDETYGQRTLRKVLTEMTDFYSPSRNGWHSPPSANGNGRHEQNGHAGAPANADAPDLPIHLTDLGNARRLNRHHGHDLRHCHPWGKWLVWDERRWKNDDTGEPARRAKNIVSLMFDEAVALIRDAQAELKEAADDEGKERANAKLGSAKKLLGWAVKSESRERLSAVVAVAESEPGIPILPDDLGSDAMLLNCPNGTLDLRTGKLREHRREDYLTALCPTPFDRDAKCPEWERFLSSIFPATGDAAEEPGNPQLIGFVQRYFGYCLTGSVIEQILAILWGNGANGKTTALNTIADTVGPDYVMRAPPGFLMLNKGERHPTELADLFGKRLVCKMESAEDRRLDEEQVKALTGGDRIRARRMKEDFWEFAPTHKIIICTNHRPKIKGTDHGIWRRLRLVPFAVRFWNPDEPAKPGEDRPEHLRQDKQLAAKLRAEAPGILAWLVRGCLDWQRDGLGTVDDVGTATADYRAEQDLLAAFFDECCTLGPDQRVKSKALYGAFREWAEDGGERSILTRKQFGEAMTEKDFRRFTSAGTWYEGLSLAPQ